MERVTKMIRHSSLFIALMAVFIIIMTPIAINAENNAVSNVEELKSALEAAIDGEIIVLGEDFVFGDIELEMPNVNVIIDGNNNIWDSGSTTISGEGTGNLTIKNLKYDGTNIDNAIITVKNSKGNVLFENVEITGSKQFGAMKIDTGRDAKTELRKVWIHDNIGENTAPAIWLGQNSNVDITNSTIENNTGTGGGYETGSISSKNYKGNLNICNSVFRNNINKTVNTGVVGGGGGAMALHYFYGNLNIENSIFDGNHTNGENGNMKSTYDGGAIYILDGRDGATFNVTGSTFVNNIAYDDGGAMMIQGTGNPGLTTQITNSTFFNNKAYGLDGANYAGGAIQFFKNGGSSKMTNNVLSSTFVGNEAGNLSSTTEQRGGAIGLSGAGTFSMAAVTRNDSLFIGNKVYGKNSEINNASNYKDLSNYTTTQAGEGKANVINVDKGADPVYSPKDIFGVTEPKLSTNGSKVKAGYLPEPVQTIMIKPGGIADNGYDGTEKPDPFVDQRDFPRYQDYGAVEISNIVYYANGGEFALAELGDNEYDGTFYYEKDEKTNETNNEIADKITKYYSVGGNGNEGVIVDGIKDLNGQKDDLVIIGWSEDPDALEPDAKYSFGETIIYEEEDIELYAVWGKIQKYEVIYDGNGHTAGNVPTDKTEYDSGDTVEVLYGKGLEKEGYIFKGWSTDKYSEKVQYVAGDTFTIEENTTLYAVWEKDDYNMYFLIWDWNKETEESTQNHKAYINGYPDGRIMPQGEITRGEVAAIIARLHADVTEINYGVATPYSDVKDSDWYAKHISYVTDNNLMEGYEDGEFKPEEKITRAEYATVIARFKGLEKADTHFNDSKTHWASGNIGAVYSKKWIEGYPDGTFKPMNNITRAEVAAMTNKMLDRRVNQIGFENISIKKFVDLEYGQWYYFDIVEASNTHDYIRQNDNYIMEKWVKK
ncbi:MAG: hypothetical protein GXZ08_05160 [Tissierellia bacterium]|nr:hypothetical protein [Tissierellia bacterium]